MLWSVLWVLAFQVLPWPRPDVPAPSFAELPVLLVWPNSTTWFVYGLALFFAVTWLARRVPTALLLGAALMVSVVAARVDTGSEPIDKMGMYYVFFVAAVRFGPRVRELAPRVRAWHAAALVPAFLALAVGVTATGLIGFPGARFAVSTVAVAGGIAAAVVLSRVRSAAWLVTLGRNTLPVYLLHSYPLLGATALLAGRDAGPAGWAPVVAPVLTVVATVVALLVHRATRGVPGLYDVPRRLALVTEPRPVAPVAAPVGR